MPVLRELISRFSFETDKKSVAQYNKTINGMQNSAKKLGSILGISLGAKALFNFGLSALAAKENLKSAAGVKFDQLNKDFERTKTQLNSIRDGLGDLITEKSFAVLGKGFIDTFGRGNKELERFQFLLKQSAIEAGKTGKRVEDVFVGFQEAITTGDFAGLKGVGGLILKDIKTIGDIQARIEAGEIGGDIGRQQKFNKLVEVLNATQAEQIRRVQGVSDEFFIVQETVKKANQNIDEFSESVFTKGAGVINTIFEMADSLKKDFDRIEKGGDILQEKDKSFFLKDKEKNTSPILGGLFEKGNERINKIEIKTTNHFNGMTNEKEIAEQIDKSNKKMLQDASNQIIRSEQK